MSNDITVGEPSMVLTFIGVNMLISPWYHVPVGASLTILAVLTGSNVIVTLQATRRPSS